jgi:hypothetical protein
MVDKATGALQRPLHGRRLGRLRAGGTLHPDSARCISDNALYVSTSGMDRARVGQSPDKRGPILRLRGPPSR